MSTDPLTIASDMAAILAPRLGVRSPEHLREAIWHRCLADPTPPTEADVAAYVWHCRARQRPISGRHGRAEPIRPIEAYHHASGVFILDHQTRAESEGGQASWTATDSVGELVAAGRSRARVMRTLERSRPGGRWIHVLPFRERRRVLQVWREALGSA